MSDALKESLPNDLNELKALILHQREEIEALNTELAETNQGVVALYSELEDQAIQLKEATELKSRFLSYMSHEFRTPLGAIRSISRILLDRLDGQLTDEQEKQVKFIMASAVELSEMVDDLLDLAKVEAGRVTISPEWFELVDLFAALRGMFKPVINSTSIDLIFEETSALPKMYSDNKKLSHILRNFISNALKFTSEGEVRVGACLVEDDFVEFWVSDTGIGIAKESLDIIFMDYIQIDSHVQKNVRGSGLGLALSKRLAELLGGRLAVISDVGIGSRFSVFLPKEISNKEFEEIGSDAPISI